MTTLAPHRGVRGAWLEKAVQASLDVYAKLGACCVQRIATPAGLDAHGRFYRERSTVDYVGVWKGKAVAFDAKATRAASLPHENVHRHQREFLQAFHKAGGVAGLLVAFEGRGARSFFVDITWYEDVIDELDHRCSIPINRFILGAHCGELCFDIRHGTHGVAVPLHVALDPLTSR